MNPVSAINVVRTTQPPIQPKPGVESVEAALSSKQTEPHGDQEEVKGSNKGEDQNVGEDAEKAEPPKKRNLWWLKKRRKKRSRLTYIKTKYRRKDDERVPSSAEASKVGGGVADPEQPYSTRPNPAFEKPKRGRPPKILTTVVPTVKLDEELRNSSDPDWDASEERKRVKCPVKKRRGRFRKGELVAGFHCLSF